MAWERRLPSPSTRVWLQWANAHSRWRDPFFWISLVPLVVALAGLVYGILSLALPKIVMLALLGVGGLALLQFAERWGVHYVNFAVTDEGILRVFPQRGIPGPLRLFPLLQALWARPRLLPWGKVQSVQRISSRIQLLLRQGATVEIELRPLRLLRGGQAFEVGRRRGRGQLIAADKALEMIEGEIRSAIERANVGDPEPSPTTVAQSVPDPASERVRGGTTASTPR